MGFIARLRSRAKKRRAAGGPRVRLAAVGGGEEDEEAAAAAALAAVLSPSKRPTTAVKWLQMTEKAIGDGHAAARLSAKVRRDVPPWG